MIRIKNLFGEFLGTCILSFIGCSAVAFAVLSEMFSSIVPTACIWGLGVTLAIYATKSYSNAHLNPAVSFGFYTNNEINIEELFSYWFVQLLGGFFAGLGVYFCFISEIENFESIHNHSAYAFIEKDKTKECVKGKDNISFLKLSQLKSSCH